MKEWKTVARLLRVSSLARPPMPFTLVEAALQLHSAVYCRKGKRPFASQKAPTGNSIQADKPKDDTIGKNEWKGAPVSRR
ncbi:hypothetical protein T4B_6778 [Trichinella pseudospiralis]|uniref:Uncharacterized protein n=2 Tax=Trichinella pseudospiralis TaxID=6337 RepID=A0A0V1IWJ5_TRIPS|nr:hypothetical protein T4A_904 [Trichinella pseudospiralis]KRY90772.1 hypothetical protein T4D_2401 [Trichinella pseudospiralis]KRZ27078.1 hypothetical protein T4B_6778 [Trichinella pseudospiralis]KRZ43142.1 hypothetical protein T4C_5790 [Trichinella pseudospiralis]